MASSESAAAQPTTSDNASSVFCGLPQDRQELQSILRSKTLESGIDGTSIDLTSPPVTPRRGVTLNSKPPFCGDQNDAQELQAIFASIVAERGVDGEHIIISDDENITSPPRKRQSIGDDGSDPQHLQNAILASLGDLTLPVSVESPAALQARIAAGLSAPSAPPAPSSTPLYDDDNPFGYASGSCDAP